MSALPDFPSLPADVAGPIADFDRRIRDGSLPLTAQGHPVIPEAAEAWITDHLAAHLPADDLTPGTVAWAPAAGDPAPRDAWRDSDGFQLGDA